MRADINGTKLFFDTIGTQFLPDGEKMKEQPVLFLLHGGPGGDHTVFLPDHLALQDDMYQIMVDDRNCGRSERGDITTSSMEQDADDIEALRQYLGLGKIFVMGISYGGMSAQKYAIKYQQNLYGLILESTAPSHLYYEEVPAQMEKMANEEQRTFMKRYRAANISAMSTEEKEALSMEYWKVLGPLYAVHFDYEKNRQSSCRGITNEEVHSYQRAEMNTFDFREDLKTVTCPTLIMCGEKDFVTPPQHSREIAQAIQGSELLILDNCSHLMTTDCPEIVFSKIREFVKKNFH